MYKFKIVNKIEQRVNEYQRLRGSTKSWIADQVGISKSRLYQVFKGDDMIFNLIREEGIFSKRKNILNYFDIFKNNKFTSESYFHKHINLCLDVVLSYFNNDEEFEVYDEYETEYGVIDIFFDNYHEQTFDIVELKKDQITRKNIYQIYDYLMAIEKKFNTDINNIHGILIGSGIMENKDVIKLASRLNISIYKYEIESEFPLLVKYTLLHGKSNKYIEQTNGVLSDDVYINYPMDDEFKKAFTKIKKGDYQL